MPDTLARRQGRPMDREGLMKLIRRGPIRITMNTGETYDVPGIEFATVSDISASILYKSDDGKWRHYHLPLVTMASVEELQPEG